MTENSNARTERIDAAMSTAFILIGELTEKGSVAPGQVAVIVAAVLRKAVPNAKPWEIRESAKRIDADLERVRKQ